MERLLPFAIGMLIASSAHAGKQLHDWEYYKYDDGGIVLQTSRANGYPLIVSCPEGMGETPQGCATRIERDMLTPAVMCALVGKMISCKIP